MSGNAPRFGPESWITLGVIVLLILAVTLKKALLVLMAGLLGLTGLTAHLWGKYSLARVEYHRRFGRDRVFAGETVDLEVEVVNRKVLPLPQLLIDDEMPDELEVQGRHTRFVRIGKGLLRHLFTMAWYQRVIRRFTVVARRRGFYKLGPTLLQSGDPFGFLDQMEQRDEAVELLVYPRIVELEQLGIPSRRPFGDVKSRDKLFEDPSRYAGVREYMPGDPLNRVHWKASAAAGVLQTRLFDPSVNAGLAIFLDARSFEHGWEGIEPVSFELGCSTAASIIAWAVKEEVSAGLYANGVATGWGQTLRLAPSRGDAVLEHALEGLARLLPVSGLPLAALIEEELPSLGYGSSVVVVARMVTDALAAAIVRVQRSGRPVTLVLTGDGPAPRLQGVRIYQVSGEGALADALLA